VPLIWNFHFGFTAEVPIPTKLVEVLKLFKPQNAKGDSLVVCTVSWRPAATSSGTIGRKKQVTAAHASPTVPAALRPQIEQSHFKILPFAQADIACLAHPEIIAEKLRSCFRRNKARDIHDLGVFATRPLDQPLVRRLVVLKLWQTHDTFDPTSLTQKFKDGKDFDWDDLRQLLIRAAVIDHDRITADCLRGFGFLAKLTPDEQVLSNDKHQRERPLVEELKATTARGE
jgi:Nucleotidyl transferase AbiEii toxin, Type IV TA system